MHPQPRSAAARVTLLATAALLLSGPALPAQQPATARPKDPVARNAPQTQDGNTDSRVAIPGSVALSPDGETVAWTLRGREGSALHLTSVSHPDPANEKLISVAGAANCTYSTPFWSPDGKTLAFLSDCAALEGKQSKGQLQVFLWSRASGETRQLTHLTGEIQQPAWSPDGKNIAFLFVENASRSAGALDAMKPWSGVIGEDGVEVQRVYTVSATDGQGQYLTPLTLHVYEFTFSPDSREIAYVGADAPGENNWWIAKIWAASARLGSNDVPQQPRLLVDPPKVAGSLHGLQVAVPRWSPDGRQIAFIGGLMSDQGSTGGDLYVVDAKGGQPTDITPGIDGTPSYEDWIGNHTLGFVEDRRGHTLLVDWDIDRKAAVAGGTRDLGEVSIGGGPIKDAVSYSPAKEGRIAFTEQGFTKAPEIWTATDAGARQLTHLNDGARPSARTESVEWTNGQFHVQGWLTFPRNFDPSRKYPVIVTVHGGPSASVTARWSSGPSSWADKGYFELQPNPRGSFGQGEAFTEANRKDFGYGDLKDIEAGLDFVETKYPIDHNREGITGWSYGGFMTMFAVTQTHRFKAAVAGAGLADWLSYYGENSIDQWMIPFFGASVYDDPAVYARSSPITYIKNVTTPTLVIVGDRDGECPAPQSFEFWHALRDLGVKTQLVVYPDEGHGFRNPEHIRDRAGRTAKWFADNMPASTSDAPKSAALAPVDPAVAGTSGLTGR
ncbi:MAG TPA: S9 family peptidase [Acidobacteriaceae bacterium]|nr:S9 family peptidase [Acidobacteriaceae bacterium]